jgi:hypothetical protein
VAWEERWYPAHDIGGLSWANGKMAASLRVVDTNVEVELYAPRTIEAHLVLRKNGAPVVEWDVLAGPGQTFRALYPVSGAGSPWDLQIWQDDILVAQIGL